MNGLPASEKRRYLGNNYLFDDKSFPDYSY